MFKKSTTVNFWGGEIDERLFPRSGFKTNEQRQSLLQALTMIIVQVNTKFKTPVATVGVGPQMNLNGVDATVAEQRYHASGLDLFLWI